jgi:hypothetical protein
MPRARNASVGPWEKEMGGDRLDELERAVDLVLWVGHRQASPLFVAVGTVRAQSSPIVGASTRTGIL